MCRCLYLTGCPVTDEGIRGLCVGSIDEFGRNNEKTGNCKSINTLSMNKTKVSKKGVEMAIENLPDLKTFHFSRSVEILAELYEAALDRESPDSLNKYSFKCKVLSYSASSPYKSGNLRRAASICPSVNTLRIGAVRGLNDTELQGLLELKNIREMEMFSTIVGEEDDDDYLESEEEKSNEDSEEDDFFNDLMWPVLISRGITLNGGIHPLLKSFGKSLTRLKLSHLKICFNMLVMTIAECCPLLEELKFEDAQSYSARGELLEEEREPGCPERPNKDTPVLKNLKKLDLSDERTSHLTPEMLLFLLSSPSLMSLDLMFCSALTDDVVEEAVKLHQFRNLESLHIFKCNSITKKGIDFFMNGGNPLEKLDISDCSYFEVIGPNRDVEEWRNLAREENWIFEINFFSFRNLFYETSTPMYREQYKSQYEAFFGKTD